MKVTISSVLDVLSYLRIRFQAENVARHYGKEEPFRSELYTAEQMDRLGKTLAAAHQLQKKPSPDRLLKRLDDNEKKLLEIRNLLIQNVQSEEALSPAAEWLLDNYYLVGEQVALARKHLPKGYSEGLPCLSQGASAGLPRVYDIALEIISHSDGWVDVKSLSGFLNSYQTVTQLTLGELWAVPIMLRLAVIENLRRVSGNVALDMVDDNLAAYWAHKLVTTARKEPNNLILTVADMAKSKPVLSGAFVACFTQKLQGLDILMTLPLNWMEQQLTEPGSGVADLIRRESGKQAANQVSVRNSIGTLRLLGTTDWREFVENLSSVEEVLKQDPSGTYPLMDFATRDSYRHVVERLSKSGPLSETEVAQKIVALAQKKAAGHSPARETHIGYYLLDKGFQQAARVTGMRYTLPRKWKKTAARHPLVLYLSGIALVTMAVAGAMWGIVFRSGMPNHWLLLFTAVVAVMGAMQLAVSLINWLSTIMVQPRLLPRMDFSKGIPPESQTLVVIPTLLSDKDAVNKLAEKLEIYYLANTDAHLSFGLLTDFADADLPEMPDDRELLDRAIGHMEALNLKYPRQQGSAFFLFHRPRQWNASERKWMGYERKRGKLAALNALVRGQGEEEFSHITGNYHTLAQVRYIVTLDSDTQLPRESVWKLVAAMAHPLNRGYYDPKKKRVTAGYGILQPRLASAMPEKNTTPYLQLQGNTSGIDPYTRVSSDVYQDLFAQGSFIGKGIYDVDLFSRAVHGVFRENTILSHDLLEGCYARCGLLSDVVLYEENPAHYSADVKRHYRWIRGDWQIAAWTLPFVPGSRGKWVANPLSVLSKWKIFDNLRRSLLPLNLLLLLLAGCFVWPYPWFWAGAFSLILLLPLFMATGWRLLHKPSGTSLRTHLYAGAASFRHIISQFIFNLAVLPYEAFKYTDAAIRTLWRLLVTRKNLLEWTTSATASLSAREDLPSAYLRMWIAPVLAIICAVLFFRGPAESVYVGLPVILLWLAAPGIAWWLGRPEKEETLTLKAEQIVFLQKCARKTWFFFEQFLTADDNWLPPDNYQEQPVAKIAHRTSPTNMGMALLANLAACDFGYIPGSEWLYRCQNTLQSMQKLERFNGHFYNWYNTQTLQPLPPRYVSTVDSGNLIGHLLTLRQAFLALSQQPICSPRMAEGFHTTFQIALEAGAVHKGLKEKIKALLNPEKTDPRSVEGIQKQLDRLSAHIKLLPEKLPGQANENTPWIQRLAGQVDLHRTQFRELACWAELLPVPDECPLLAGLDEMPTYQQTRDMPEKYLPLISAYAQQTDNRETLQWLELLRKALLKGSEKAAEKLQLAAQMAVDCEALSQVDYGILLNTSNHLMHIGYNVEEQKKDKSYYDLLASEARLGIFAGISQGQLPLESWFVLGRQLTHTGKKPVLLSWSGTMFEYLMPQLVMPSYKNTLLYQTAQATVEAQIDYATRQHLPWGISESAYNQLDANLNYQYRAFGVPGLGLKRGLEEDLVMAPYASLLALMVNPARACDNLQRLSREGFAGDFGFYEAIDFTAGRRPKGKAYGIVYSFMVHHQSMGLLSLAYLLLNQPMQQRFVAELRFQATLLLLQEQIPKTALYFEQEETVAIGKAKTPKSDAPMRIITTPNTPTPEIGLLSNGRYQVMISNAGGGYSRWKDIAVSRWRQDTTLDNNGIFCYIREMESNHFWSNTYQPTLQTPEKYSVQFSQGLVEFFRQDEGIDTRTEIVVSPEDDTEKRRIKLTNRNRTAKTLEITSYAEIVLNSQAADEAHPAFSNLFVQTEILQEAKAIICTRRPRSEEEKPPYMFHLMDMEGAVAEALSYETDRMEFIGRNRTTRRPKAMEQKALSGNQGPVLDPIMAIRYRIRLKPGQTAVFDLIYGIADTRAGCENLLHKYRDRHLKSRSFELSWTHSQVQLRQINVTEGDAQLYDRLASSVIYPSAALRAETTVIRNNNKGQSGLWGHSISGDLPIVLLQLSDPEKIDLLKQLVQAHIYWQMKGLATDLVIFNEVYGSYRQDLQNQIQDIITAENGHRQGNNMGNIYLKSGAQVSPEDRTLLESVARVIIRDSNGPLTAQLIHPKKMKPFPSNPLRPVPNSPVYTANPQLDLPENLLFFNGTGGFTPDGTAYQIRTGQQEKTPAPWVNVLANPGFGTVISESGSAYSWAVNAHEYRLTPWNDDPVSDNGGEAFYLRDEKSGHFWSPAPFPAIGKTPYITTHSFGYSRFAHAEEGIYSEMTVSVDKKWPVKFITLKIKNLSGQDRQLSVTGFMEILLGDLHARTEMHIISEQEAQTGALLFRNKYNTVFAERIAFFTVNETVRQFTADRTEFIGRNGSLQEPRAMGQTQLSGSCGAGMDPCAALQVACNLLNGEEKEIIFLLGSTADDRSAIELIQQFTAEGAAAQSLSEVTQYWKETVGKVKVNTPDPALNLLANGWLVYQTMACRVFARSGFYQSGGAFGFRDQLQDVLALLHSQPELARRQILLSSSRQFVEGDVQHWWHPPEGRGVRTHCSDDLLWLPFAVNHYIETTGDAAILKEETGFLESRLLQAGEDSNYDLPVSGNQKGTLYEHCTRAIRHSLASIGNHGLPLMGSGDWNDGMDKVGNKGQGESVWLAFFLYDILMDFTGAAIIMGDTEFSATCQAEAARLQSAIGASAWDGQWWLRAWFDDGSPLGSKDSDCCRIDALAQSWSVLSGAGTEARNQTAMASLEKYLVSKEMRLIKLLAPPFDGTGPNPGYIQGYVPGIRENGGQYTHAAVWSLMAFAAAGEQEKTWELFNMVNPVRHTETPDSIQAYKVEPYVMAADVYASDSHKGRGGWTWYTGSAGWMYQFIIGSLLGIRRKGNTLECQPYFPLAWPSVSIDYRYKTATYHLTVIQAKAQKGNSWEMDGEKGTGNTLLLSDDAQQHTVTVFIGLQPA